MRTERCGHHRHPLRVPRVCRDRGRAEELSIRALSRLGKLRWGNVVAHAEFSGFALEALDANAANFAHACHVRPAACLRGIRTNPYHPRGVGLTDTNNQ